MIATTGRRRGRGSGGLAGPYTRIGLSPNRIASGQSRTPDGRTRGPAREDMNFRLPGSDALAAAGLAAMDGR